MPKPLELKSFEDASVIRKFSVLFSLMSLFPFVILAILFFIFNATGEIKIDPNIFFWIVFFIGIFAFIGFISMRRTFMNLMTISKNASDILKGDFAKRINIKTGGENEITQLARAFNEIVQRLESNIQELEKSRNTLQEVLLKFASGVSYAENIDVFLDLILETTVNALGGNIGLLIVNDEEKNVLFVKSAAGLDARRYKGQKVPLEEEVVGWVIKQKKPLLIPKLHRISAAESKISAFMPPLISAPLIFQNKVIGAITISGKKQEGNFEEDELIILSNLGSQVALAIENARLNIDNQKTYIETVTALALAVEARDVYSRGHSDRVRDYAGKIAEKLGLNAQQITTIREAAQLHDVGKIGISDGILRKQGALDELEYNIMKQHPVIGEGIILPLRGLAHLRDPVRHHHEWLNGEGYPDHLKGDEISIEARILTVVDCFDAITTDRPYRKAMDFQQAKQELLRYKDTRYDDKVLEALFSCLNL